MKNGVYRTFAYVYRYFPPNGSYAGTRDVENFSRKLTFRCKRHFDAGGSRCSV